ncbi:hypothetical protein SHP1_094 [Salmonella phage SHP1]|nr:hypothetical protein SHP1_094 [Salmonella phage SHP1]
MWKSHISKYNQSEYLVLYQQFCLYIQSQGFEGAPSFEEFKKILETVFQAYCLLR